MEVSPFAIILVFIVKKWIKMAIAHATLRIEWN
jgi:hypothetical protein